MYLRLLVTSRIVGTNGSEYGSGGIAVDSSSNIYTSAFGVLKKYNSSGTLISNLVSQTNSIPSYIVNMALDSTQSNLYWVDADHNIVSVYNFSSPGSCYIYQYNSSDSIRF